MIKNFNSHTYEYEKLRAVKPSFGYNGTQRFSDWQACARKKLNELLGLPFERCDPAFEIEDTRICDGFTKYRFTVQTESGYHVPSYLLIPHQAQERIPLTVCLSGHGAGMHIALGEAKNDADAASLTEWPHRAMAPRSIKEGRAALVIEARNFGESSLDGYGTSCTEAAKIAILMGRTVIGERVWDAMRILDAVAKTFPQVDMTDILCTGNSGGGTAAYYLACMDERITAAAPSCSVCTYETSIAAMEHCMCNHVPGIRKYFEMGDLAGLIAPRKLIVAAGAKDPIFPLPGVLDAYGEIERLYRLAGVPDNCALVVESGGHLNYADRIWKKFREMNG
jgi:cephalosporin-C deacetylase-like acetyl esterase